MSESATIDVAAINGKLAGINLGSGSHSNVEAGMCIMEAVAWLDNLPFNDAPKCVSPVLRSFLIVLNDRSTETSRQRLKEIIPDIMGSASRGDEMVRMYRLVDWACRFAAPLGLRAGGFEDEAKDLENLEPVIDRKTARVARDRCRVARDKCWAVYRATAAADAATAAATAADAAAAATAAATAATADAAAADAATAAATAADATAARVKAREENGTKIMDSAIPLIRELAA